MDLSLLPNAKSHDASASYTTVPQQQLFSNDFAYSDWPMSDHLWQQHDLPPGSQVPLNMVSNVDWSGSNLSQLEQFASSSIIPMGLPSSTFNLQSENFLFDARMSQNERSLQNPLKRKSPTTQPIPPKRERKAATMSQQRWEPATDRIRQLYVVDGKSIKEVQKIINAEFGFNAT